MKKPSAACCKFLLGVRHEMPKGGELANQNIKDRFHGQNDPVALKMLRRADPTGPPDMPADKSITTIWIGGIDETTSEQDLRYVRPPTPPRQLHAASDALLRQLFYPFGEISSCRVVHNRYCAFLTFVRRDSAEEAISALWKDAAVRGSRLRLDWGRSQKGECGRFERKWLCVLCADVRVARQWLLLREWARRAVLRPR